jgi:hypothetical protein
VGDDVAIPNVADKFIRSRLYAGRQSSVITEKSHENQARKGKGKSGCCSIVGRKLGEGCAYTADGALLRSLERGKKRKTKRHFCTQAKVGVGNPKPRTVTDPRTLVVVDDDATGFEGGTKK